EVMVFAYGTAKNSSFTGSAAGVSSDQIGKIQSSNVTNALSGKVSGVQLNNTTGQPGASSPTIRIRGISSINAGKDPLVILDGVPYDGDMNNLNGQDIESMTVLKDAASSALYGARGANGVIIITTKKGNAGQAKITVDAKWGSNSRATQNYNYVTDPAQYYEMWYGALKNYFVNAQGMNATNAHIMANNNLTTANSYGLGYNVYSVPAGQFMIGENGKLNPNARLGNVVSYNGQEYTLLPDDWTDAAYKNGLRQEYSLTATAGTDKSSFFASFNYLDNEGITENSDFTRITGRLKADYQLKDWIKIGANMGYAHFDANSLDADEDGNSSSSGNVFALTMMAPIYPLYMRDGNGKIMKDANGITRYDYGDGENAGLKRPYLGQSNALSSNILDVHNSEGNAINAVGFAEIRFLKDFKFTTTNSVMMDETRLSMVTNPYYGAYANSNGILYKYHTRQLAYNYQQLLNYKHSFGAHNVEAMLGHEAYTYKYYYLYANKTQMFDPTNSELAGAILDGSNSSYTTKYNTEGYFGRVQYDYNEKYFVSGSYRRDASSRFHPDNRWGNFWSLGGAWLISKESFFDVSWINELKIKASFGSQGNDAIGDFRYTDTYSIVNSNGKPAAVPNRRGNKDITWETNANFNAGVDFKLFKSRLNGTIEFFNRKTTDMLFSFPLPPTFGYTSYAANVGDMRNMGIEAELEGVILDTNDLKWTVNLNLTHYKNKVTYLPDERKTMTVDGVDGYSSGSYYYGENIPLYTFYMYK
ncbi:MAG: SusC/RagA family TonB-linked outer membrane protein, partial [Bacteroides sp.]|nr:SusC/RagA family TonB-linked outer membrane protein [Bacteroides sp.]